MNAEYFSTASFVNDNASLGNVIWFPDAIQDGFKGSVKCSAVNPPNNCKKPANTECEIIGNIFNDKINVNATTGTFEPTFKQKVGFVINSSFVDQYVGRCYYLWDSGTAARMNRGCGLGASAKFRDCDENQSAYRNICKSGKTCSTEDPEVSRAMCGDAYPAADGQQCFLPGPAVNWKTGSDPDESFSGNLKKMVQERVKKSTDAVRTKPTNIIIDAELFWRKIEYDPAVAVVAVVHQIGSPDCSIYTEQAKTARNQFCTLFKQSQNCIPLVAFDVSVDVSKDGAKVYSDSLQQEILV